MNKWILCCCLLTLLSCNNGNSLLSSRPRGVLSKEKMTDMLVDINLAESALRAGDIQRTLPADSLYQKAQYVEVFKKNGVTPGEFNKSLTYYIERIEDLNDIYSDVISKLSAMEAEMQKHDRKARESQKYIQEKKDKKNPQ